MQTEQFQLHADIEGRHWWFVARRRILRDIVSLVCPPTAGRNSTVVDIGCGTGANLAALADEYRCVGVDVSAEAIQLAKKRFPGVQFIPGQAKGDVRRALAHANVVLLTDVLEHVENDRDMLVSIVADCAPGAHFVITVPADMRLWSPHDEAFGHFRRYDIQNFSMLWRDLPLRKRLVTYFNSRLYPLVRTVRAVTQWRGHAAGKANTDFRLPAKPTNAALTRIFAGERHRLLNSIDGQGKIYRRGVSLLAVLERERTEAPANDSAGQLEPASTPAELATL
jgi:SAM-dependent methyltransferase